MYFSVTAETEACMIPNILSGDGCSKADVADSMEVHLNLEVASNKDQSQPKSTSVENDFIGIRPG